MTQPTHILVPTDFDEGAEHAEEFAVSLAERLGARLTLLHVLRHPAYAYAERTAPPLDDLAPRAQDALDAARARIARRVARVETALARGAPWEAIVEQARARGAGLIVMGTHGRRGLPRLVLGSVAEKVLRTSTVPVVTVPARPRSLGSVLVATDFSEPAARACDLAIALASKVDARVTLVHVYAIPSTSYATWMTAPMTEIERSVRAALDAAAGRLRERGAKVDVALRLGVAPNEILALAREVHADLIAMGTHGHRGLSAALLGSTAERVLRAASVPVLTVRES